VTTESVDDTRASTQVRMLPAPLTYTSPRSLRCHPGGGPPPVLPQAWFTASAKSHVIWIMPGVPVDSCGRDG
jgi:hypothetical protein